MELSASFPYSLTEFKSVPGSGIQCVCNDIQVHIGNHEFLIQNNVIIPSSLETSRKTQESKGHTVVLVSFNHMFVGLLALSDIIKPESYTAINAIKKLGISVAMVTGDQSRTANFIAGKLGITEVYAGVSPAGKKRIVMEMQKSKGFSPRDYEGLRGGDLSTGGIGRKGGFVVGMVGDGVNDSASIAQADVGIAVYGGTDVAVEGEYIYIYWYFNENNIAASIVLMRPDLLDVVTAIDLSKTIFKRIQLNFVWATV